ncbi:Ycf66 family protein [Anabaenopsis tanganyikae CS-531]|uniref:Ycf66 family protein n=1 Tax=Anabaenopsis tanganyikae CS-531 TaxID=2785304 RepID=A0ABT6KJW7_9CYAN|nr:Ycf66 family protein [Anabaenopsis tanganyikae]MDH6107514.1 Ycf66 family protein [Anabaenopsis tanganyikae CS-531]
MLAYILAFVVGLGSLAIYITAFLFPEIHRKNDFIWSGVGLFYGLVLWVFAPHISGGLLLGHIASVALLVWFGWQTFSLRRQVTPQTAQTPVPSAETIKTGIQEQITKLSLPDRLAQVQQSISKIFSGAQDKGQEAIARKTPETPKMEPTNSTPPQKPLVEIIDKTAVTPDAPPAEQVPTQEVPEPTPPNPPPAEMVAAAQPETEEKPSLPAEEIAPDAALAPPAEAPVEQIPPTNQAG